MPPKNSGGAAQLAAVVTGDTNPLSAALQRASGMLHGFAQKGGGILQQAAQGIFSGFGMSIGNMLVGTVASAFSKMTQIAIGFNATLEQTQIAFSTMLGSETKAVVMIDELRRFAAKTPFEFPDLLQSSRTMLAFGFQAKQIIPTLTSVGNAAAGLGLGGEQIQRIIYNFGQMKNTGKATAHELKDLAMAGVPVWDYLSKAMGKSISETQEMVTRGAVTATQAMDAITKGMDAQFGGMMERQAKTFNGAMSTIKDAGRDVLATALKPLFDMLSAGAQNLAAFLSEGGAMDFARTFAVGFQSLIGGVEQFIGSLGRIGSTASSALSPLKAAFGSVMQLVEAALDRILPHVFNFINVFRANAIPMFTAFGNIAIKVFGAIWSVAYPVLKEIFNVASQVIGAVIDNLSGFIQTITQVAQGINDALSGNWEAAWENIKGAADTYSQTVLKYLVALANAGIDAFKFMAQRVVDAVQWMVNALLPIIQRGLEIMTGMLMPLAQILDKTGISAKLGLGNLEKQLKELPSQRVQQIKDQMTGLDNAINNIGHISIPGLTDAMDDQGRSTRKLYNSTMDFINGTVKGWQDIAAENKIDQGLFDKLIGGEPDKILESGAAASEALKKVRDQLEGIMKPTQSTDFISQLDQLGFHVDTWDEQARRMADIANRGMQSPWAKMFAIPDELKGPGKENELKAWAVRWQQAFYAGLMPQEINMQAVIDRYHEILASQEKWEQIYTDAAAAIAKSGQKVNEKILQQAMGAVGGGSGTGMVAPAAIAGGSLTAGLEAEINAKPIDLMIKSSFEMRMKGEGRKILIEVGRAAGDLLVEGVRDSLDNYDFVMEMAGKISPHVAKYIESQKGRKEAI